MVSEEFRMAKKKITPDEIIALPATPAAPKRRAPAKKKTITPRSSSEQAAAPIDIASVAGTEPQSPNGNPQPSQAEIAEAAYFRHLNRAGAPSDQFKDWVEAERELKERHSR
jgi:hypothetical protein